MDALTRMAAPLTGLARLLTGDRETAAALVHTALVRAYSERVPDERRAIAALVRAWLAGAPPVAEPAELPHDLELLRRILDALPEKQRAAVVLHHWSGLPVTEIAALLRRPERAVTADLAAGVAELGQESTVDARLAALVAAAGPPLVDLTQVAEAAQAQRRQRRRTAVVAAVVLLVAGVVAALLTGGEPDGARTGFTAGDRFLVLTPQPVIDDRARRLTAQLSAAMSDVLPGVTDVRPGVDGFPPLEFSFGSPYTPDTYGAHAVFGSTLLILQVERILGFVDPAQSSCPESDPNCTYRTFADGTWAYVTVHPYDDMTKTALSLTANRPDGTAIFLSASILGPATGPPALSVEDLFRFATVFTY